jgi:hypothetical protein
MAAPGRCEDAFWGGVVVAEDCDEYLRSDAKVRADTSLGRLLNFCDDILGHGLEVLVLLTTNEDVGRAAPCDHPSRPMLEPGGVHLLSQAEAQPWPGEEVTALERGDRRPRGGEPAVGTGLATDGWLLVVSMKDHHLLRFAGGKVSTHADLSGVCGAT